MNSKITQTNETTLAKIKEHDSKISKLTEGVNELLSKLASHKQADDHIEELLIDNKTQINLVNRCLNNAISKYDNVIIDNLLLPVYQNMIM